MIVFLVLLIDILCFVCYGDTMLVLLHEKLPLTAASFLLNMNFRISSWTIRELGAFNISIIKFFPLPESLLLIAGCL